MQSLRQLFQHYRKIHSALPSFNIDNFVIYQAIEIAVSQTNLPCLVQLSHGEDRFIRAERLFMLVKKAQADGLPIYLNMDHSQNLPRLKKLLQLGFDMVHFDGSGLNLSENLAKSLELSNFIHQQFPNPETRPLLEVEINKITSTSTGVSLENLTNPKEAFDFMQKTNADLLAVSLGNLHGRPPEGLQESLNLDLFQEITNLLPSRVFYTMHGGSGISSSQLSQTINRGVVKININTDLRLAYLKELRFELQNQNTEKIYEYYQPVVNLLQKIVTEKLLAFQNLSHV